MESTKNETSSIEIKLTCVWNNNMDVVALFFATNINKFYGLDLLYIHYMGKQELCRHILFLCQYVLLWRKLDLNQKDVPGNSLTTFQVETSINSLSFFTICLYYFATRLARWLYFLFISCRHTQNDSLNRYFIRMGPKLYLTFNTFVTRLAFEQSVKNCWGGNHLEKKKETIPPPILDVTMKRTDFQD